MLEALIGNSNNELKLDQLFVAWNDNGREIVAALASRLLSKEQQMKERELLGDQMLRHLSLTYSEMKHAVSGDESGSIDYYHETLHCIADMSRLISDAIQRRLLHGQHK